MKLYFFLLFSLLTFGLQAQTGEVTNRDLDFQLIGSGDNFSIVTLKQGDGFTGSDTLLIGDTTDVITYLTGTRARLAARRVRLTTELFGMDYNRVEGVYLDLLNQVDPSEDSTRQRRWFQRGFVDTVSLRLPRKVIPADELADFTNDTLGTDAIVVDCWLRFNASGTLRMQNLETGKNWTVNLTSRQNFNIQGFLGGKTWFSLMEQRDRAQSIRYIYRVDADAVDELGSVRITALRTL